MIRAGPAALLVAGLAIALSPLAPWFVATVPPDSVHARGLPAAGELWMLPPLGLAVIAAAIVVRDPVARARRRPPPLAAAFAGLAAAGTAVAATVGRPVVLVVEDGGAEVVTGAPVEVSPLGPGLAVVGAALAVVAGVVLARHP